MVSGLLGMNMLDYVGHDRRLERPVDVVALLGDATKAREVLGWEPRVGFDELVKMMVDHDGRLAGEERALSDHRRKTA
jgi:GDPmannose 4,6-dehydratase